MHVSDVGETVFQGPAHICLCQVVIREVLLLFLLNQKQNSKKGEVLCATGVSVCIISLFLQNIRCLDPTLYKH